MKHLIEFRTTGAVSIEQGGVSTRIGIEAGVQCPATVTCYVAYLNDRYTEVADVTVQEGVIRALPCAAFMFIDRLD
jgi:hypothetical protein